MLSLYNTKSRSIESFTPLHTNEVTMYACGPTVYDFTHIGHMRKYIGDDILRRTLSLLGYNVKHVMNITDVGHLTDDGDSGDDKFEKKAQADKKTVWEIAALYTDYFHTTMRAVGVLPPSIEAKATEHIPAMIALVERLQAKGIAYETSQGVYFDTSKDPHYGSLSGQSLDDKQTERDDVVTDPEKKHPADFALWFKRVGRFSDHSMHWLSPWGDGFPGWHIECSAMSMQYLGETIDIHTGGIDHIPVHHENEIAQSECATGHQFVRFWVHHDFLLVDGQKMSKSKHNFYTLDDVTAKGIDPLAIRILFMQTSYRKPLNFTWEALEAAAASLKKIQKVAALGRSEVSIVTKNNDSFDVIQKLIEQADSVYMQDFKQALSDDLNTAKALAVVFALIADTSLPLTVQYATLLACDAVLGLQIAQVPAFTITEEAQELCAQRTTARNTKDYALSDTLRKELEALGYEVRDNGAETILS